MNYYIKGDKERGADVIARLESKGGINTMHLTGDKEDIVYYIDKNHNILSRSFQDTDFSLLNLLCDKLTLPEKWKPKFKVGDKVEFETISNIRIGTIISINEDNKLYLIDSQFYRNEDEIRLVPWEPFRGETVLVRNYDSDEWKEAIFSYSKKYCELLMYQTVGGNNWRQCIPFDINKLGKITN